MWDIFWSNFLLLNRMGGYLVLAVLLFKGCDLVIGWLINKIVEAHR